MKTIFEIEGKEKMTRVHFVRHAQQEYSWEDDRTRALTKDGVEDSKIVTKVLKNIKVHCYSSPYKMSFETIKESAEVHNLNILTDERFRECKKGLNGNEFGMFQKRWTTSIIMKMAENHLTWFKNVTLRLFWKF